MRIPTPSDQLYAWHWKALHGLAPVNDGTPQCGWFKRKLVKGGVFVPARIWLDAETDIGTGELLAPETMLCEVNGERRDPVEQWSWLCAHPITEAEFHYLTQLRNHALLHEPSLPIATPTKPVDWLNAPMPQFRKD